MFSTWEGLSVIIRALDWEGPLLKYFSVVPIRVFLPSYSRMTSKLSLFSEDLPVRCFHFYFCLSAKLRCHCFLVFPRYEGFMFGSIHFQTRSPVIAGTDKKFRFLVNQFFQKECLIIKIPDFSTPIVFYSIPAKSSSYAGQVPAAVNFSGSRCPNTH